MVSDNFGASILNTSQLLLLFSACPAPILGAMWLGLQSLTNLYYQTAIDVGAWYTSCELDEVNLESVDCFQSLPHSGQTCYLGIQRHGPQSSSENRPSAKNQVLTQG